MTRDRCDLVVAGASFAGRALGGGIGDTGDPWKHAFGELARACGGWRLLAARGLSAAATLGAPLAVTAARVGLLRETATALAFRASAYGRKTGRAAEERP